MILYCSSQRLVCKSLKSPQNGMVDASTKTWHSLITDTESDQRGFVEIEGKLRFRSRGVFVNQSAVDADNFQSAFFQVMCLLGVQSQNLPRDLAVGYYKSRNGF